MRDVLDNVVAYIAKLRDEGGIHQFHFEKHFSLDNGSPLRPSSAGKCARQIGFKILKPELASPLPNRGTSAFLHGDLIHAQERSLIAQVADLRDVEKRFTHPSLPKGGSVDGIVYKEGKPSYILDVKSTNVRSFDQMCCYGADEGYYNQLQLYMLMSGVHDSYLWMYNKNDTGYNGKIHPSVYANGQRAVIHVPFREDAALWAIARLQGIEKLTAQKLLPERDHTFVGEIKDRKPTGRDYLPWQCLYCPFVKPCWSHLGFNQVIEKGKARWIRDNKVSDQDLLDILG